MDDVQILRIAQQYSDSLSPQEEHAITEQLWDKSLNAEIGAAVRAVFPGGLDRSIEDLTERRLCRSQPLWRRLLGIKPAFPYPHDRATARYLHLMTARALHESRVLHFWEEHFTGLRELDGFVYWIRAITEPSSTPMLNSESFHVLRFQRDSFLRFVEHLLRQSLEPS